MNVSELMTTAVECCSPSGTLQGAAQLMWERDCGVVPVVDDERHVIGMITDRDICMAAFIQGIPLWRIPVSSVMARKVYGVGESDSIEAVESLMQRVRVRRVPVLDPQGRLKGIVSMNDLARHARRTGTRGDGLSGDRIVRTLAAICEPRITAPKKEPVRSAHASAS